MSHFRSCAEARVVPACLLHTAASIDAPAMVESLAMMFPTTNCGATKHTSLVFRAKRCRLTPARDCQNGVCLPAALSRR